MIQIGVVGSGPAGFYTAYKVLKTATKSVQVDLLEANAIPYGLVRFGVAPDHPEVKAVQNKFDEIASDPRFTFFGNVRVGQMVSVDALRKRYDALVLAYGASKDRMLNIPGESSLKGIYGAKDFVGWYNGLPSHRHLQPNLTNTDTAVIIGHGNVALDVARILLTPVDTLRKTDMTEYALEALSKSRIRNVSIIGRRGPMQVSFTSKEFREMFDLPQVKLRMDLNQFQANVQWSQLEHDRPRKRLLTLMERKAREAEEIKDWKALWYLRFLLSPSKFLSKDSQMVSGVEFRGNRLENNRAIPTDQFGQIETGLVVRSIGYQVVPVPGLPFDAERNHVPHLQGRVLKSVEDSEILSGLYVSGWLKRGPSGVIATTMYDAFQTAASICADIDAGSIRNDSALSREQMKRWLEDVQQTKIVTFEDWKKVEEEEIRRGKLAGKPREKITNVQEIFKIIGFQSTK